MTILLTGGVVIVVVRMGVAALTIIRLACDGDMIIDEEGGEANVTSDAASFSCMFPSLSANKIGISKMSADDISESTLVASLVDGVVIILLICVPDAFVV